MGGKKSLGTPQPLSKKAKLVAAADHAREQSFTAQAIEKGKETRRQKKLLANHQQYVMERPRRSSEAFSTPGILLALCFLSLTVVSCHFGKYSPEEKTKGFAGLSARN